MGLRIAWDDERHFWCGRIVREGARQWRLLSDVPLNLGSTVTITPLGDAPGKHLDFRARVVSQGEDVLVSPYSEGRFWTQLRTLDLDDATDDALGCAMAA